MKGLAKAYYVWQSPCKGEQRKPVEYIHTQDGRTIPRDEWCKIALETIIQADLSDLLKQIEEYTQKHCLWVKMGDLREYSMDCLLKGSFKHWDDFCYQERLNIWKDR